ncbi:hypothetical protein N8D56_01605 [Devosia sp. A8/3-2]|nr:hypothetical protein N8D56_01605 [Devosia sp. A8/3-2]
MAPRLIALGGSRYYLPAGIGLLATAVLLYRRSSAALWVYLATYVGTLIWALWEAGLDGWAQVPRLIAPSVVLILVLTTLPALRKGGWHLRSGVAASAVTIIAALGVVAIGNSGAGRLLAQENAPAVETPPVEVEPAQPGPAAPPPAAPTYVALETGVDWPAYGGTHKATRYSPLRADHARQCRSARANLGIPHRGPAQ